MDYTCFFFPCIDSLIFKVYSSLQDHIVHLNVETERGMAYFFFLSDLDKAETEIRRILSTMDRLHTACLPEESKDTRYVGNEK